MQFTEEEIEERHFYDGIYNTSDIEVLAIEEMAEYEISKAIEREDVQEFIKKYESTWAVGTAYQTGMIFFCERKPDKINVVKAGSGFNYGSANLLVNLPNSILILAEDD